MKIITRAARNVVILVLTVLVAGCASHHLPTAAPDQTYQSSRTKSVGNLKVTVAVLGQDECRQVFGLPLLDRGIQPLWVRIENRDDIPYFFLPSSIDPDYFPPLEVAYRFYSNFATEENRKLDDFFREKGIGNYVQPDHELAGFVFTNVDLGGKTVYAKLVGPGKVREFRFYLHVPGGLLADYEETYLNKLYSPLEIKEYSEEELRQALEALPCCTTDEKGTTFGDPLNLVLIGNIEELKAAFTRRKWDETEVIYGGSIKKTVLSFFLGTRYRYSPVSPLYSFGRRQDFAMQKIRDSVDARNHLRLWLTPMRYEGKPVWLGQISRDLGVRFTTKTWNFTTHQISPNIDEARDFFVEDLLTANRIEKLGYLKGVGPATKADNRSNLTGDGYFSDGLRAIMVFTDQSVPINDVKIFNWEWHPKRRDHPLSAPVRNP